MNNVYILISIFIICIVMFFTCYKPSIVSFDSKKPGINILLVGGTHGNEISGATCLLIFKNMLKNNKVILKSGKVTIIDDLNYCGYYIDSRYYNKIGKKYDLNRLYDKNFIINKKVEKLVKENDLILDFHEGWGYIGRDKGSIGSSLTFSGDINQTDKKNVIELLNKDIKIEYKKFQISKRKSIPHSLREYAQKYNKKYVLLETTGQNHIQPLNIRVDQCFKFVSYFLSRYKVI